METKFIQLTEILSIREKIEKGDCSAIDYLISEIQRLECIIRDYELGIRIIKEKLESQTNKEPNKF